jgi:4-amino-4-deoxy-L-arabinose transferase-like glycosyltransferase
MGLFGQNRFAMRLIPLAFGSLSIPAAYALGRAWWSRRMGLIAAAFLATYPAHVYFSRLALYNIIDPFFALLALAALARALRWIRLADFALAGVLAGIAQYFYHGSRLLPVLMIVYVIVYTFNARSQSGKDAKFYQSLLGMFFAFLVVSLPRFAPMFAADLPLTGNLNAIRLPVDLGENALRSVLAWVGQPDVSPFWLSSEPLLPLLALVTCAIGLVICLRHLRDPRHAVIVATLLLTTIFGGVIWLASPFYVRYMTALPAIVLLVALPFERYKNKYINRQDAKIVKSEYLGRVIIWAVVSAIVMQGTIISLQQPAEAYGRIPAGLWEQDALAQSATQLPAGEEAKFNVSANFSAVDRITIADYVAAYGQRRAVSVTTK